MFSYMPNLSYIDFGNLNTSKLVSMSHMFEEANLQNTDLNLIDTLNTADIIYKSDFALGADSKL